MRNFVTYQEFTEALREIYIQTGQSGIEATASGETLEQFKASLGGISCAAVMLADLLFHMTDEEMELVEQITQAGEQWALDTVRDHYKRIIGQI